MSDELLTALVSSRLQEAHRQREIMAHTLLVVVRRVETLERIVAIQNRLTPRKSRGEAGSLVNALEIIAERLEDEG